LSSRAVAVVGFWAAAVAVLVVFVPAQGYL
jgi:uncharacterized membrane protein YdfJ with MMPL/SSD domain